MTSLIEDCQAWINKGQESWKSYFSKWETFAEYEESFPESELIHEFNDKPRERRNINQKLLRLPVARKGLKRVFFKNQQRNQKKLIKKKKSSQKCEAERKNHGNKSLVESLENKEVEKSLMTVFSDLLKANTNNYELFAVLFQTFTESKVTVMDLNHLLSKQVVPHSNFEWRATNFESQRPLSLSMLENNHSFENQRLLSISMPGNTLALENPRVLSASKLRKSLSGRSICPPRNLYLQNLNIQESNYEQGQSNLRQGQNPKVGACDANNISQNNFSKQQSSTSDGSQTPMLEKRSNLLYEPDLFRIKNTKSVEFEPNHKFPKSFYPNKECISTTISELSVTKEDRRHGNLSLQLRTNRISLSMDNANFITAQKKLSEHKHLSKMLPQKRRSSENLISDCNESDSDSDDQTKYSSPRIHCQSKRLKADEQFVDALEPDDDCQHIFDRVKKL